MRDPLMNLRSRDFSAGEFDGFDNGGTDSPYRDEDGCTLDGKNSVPQTHSAEYSWVLPTNESPRSFPRQSRYRCCINDNFRHGHAAYVILDIHIVSLKHLAGLGARVRCARDPPSIILKYFAISATNIPDSRRLRDRCFVGRKLKHIVTDSFPSTRTRLIRCANIERTLPYDDLQTVERNSRQRRD